MRVRYRVTTGELTCWLNDLGYITVIGADDMDVATYKFDINSENPTFVHDGECIHIRNFEYYKVEDLIDRLARSKDPEREDDRRFVFSWYFLETLLRDTANVGIVGEFESYSAFVPGIGIGLKGSGSVQLKCLMIPCERRYRKEDWHYKVEFCPEDVRLRKIVGTETWSFDDLAKMIESGIYSLVDIKSYRTICPDDCASLGC